MGTIGRPPLYTIHTIQRAFATTNSSAKLHQPPPTRHMPTCSTYAEAFDDHQRAQNGSKSDKASSTETLNYYRERHPTPHHYIITQKYLTDAHHHPIQLMDALRVGNAQNTFRHEKNAIERDRTQETKGTNKKKKREKREKEGQQVSSDC